jgi:subtilisin family serine protease
MSRYSALPKLLMATVCCVYGLNCAIAAESVQLAILLSQSALDFPRSPEDLIAQTTTRSPEQTAILARLGNPITIRALTTDRSNVKDRGRLPVDDPKRLLDSYVVLSFADALAADSARQLLLKDKAIAYIALPHSYQFNAFPNDPLFAFVSGGVPLDRQWGMRTLNLEPAWDYIYGATYVGVVDNGIQENHEDLQWNYRAHFSGAFIPGGCITSPDEMQRCGTPVPNPGHGTMVAGIIAASRGNGIGVAGACRNCSLSMARIGVGGQINQADIDDGINAMVSRGMQVINLSFGDSSGASCLGTPLDARCLAIAFAAQRDVVLVAAAGNNKATSLDFPASDWRVIAVGGTQSDGNLWNQMVALGTSPARDNHCPNYLCGKEIGTNSGSGMAVVAPARDVLSTGYTAKDFNPDIRVGTAQQFSSAQLEFGLATPQAGFSQSASAPYNLNYGIGTGTSFAAPHVTGIMGLLRGANPLISTSTLRTYLTSHASRSSTPDNNWGYGVPDAHASAIAVLTTNSRLTPLFTLFNSTYDDYVLTKAPQMAVAAMTTGMMPQPAGGASNYYPETSNATTTLGYSAFPGAPGGTMYAPRARLKVFTTKIDSTGTDLCHVFRYSYVNSVTVRHVYAVCAADRSNISSVWAYDGIEGYVYPPTGYHPAGTVAIYRWVKPATSTYMLVPNGDQAFWTSKGFVSDGTGVLGYAYLN